VYGSVILRPRRTPREIPQLSLIAGLASAEAIEDLTGLIVNIRWPNDLLISGHKVGGILVEHKANATVLGIGLNVSTHSSQLPETATSLLAAVSDTRPERAEPLVLHAAHLTAQVLRRFQTWYRTWTLEGFPPIRKALLPRIGMFGLPVQVEPHGQSPWPRVESPLRQGVSPIIQGIAADLDEEGRLLVRLDSGILHPVTVGDIRLLRSAPRMV
jgi:BirA family biotin operon repressor/biotin-[acetyl-CoA-carboxylase] ligase